MSQSLWFHSNRGCSDSCALSNVRRGVMITPYCVKAGPFFSPCLVLEKPKREQSGRRCLWREGMRHWISAWESVPAFSCWAAETPLEGHDTRCSLSLHQAFHMSRPSLTSSPGWRKKGKHMVYCFSSCFTSPWVGFSFFFSVVICVWLRLLALLLSG